LRTPPRRYVHERDLADDRTNDEHEDRHIRGRRHSIRHDKLAGGIAHSEGDN
jgi:hypothetical protein